MRYLIQVFAFISLIVGANLHALAQPANDDLCDAEFLPVGDECTAPFGDNTGATEQPNEPFPGCHGTGTNSVWYTFTAPAGGAVVIRTAVPASGSLDDTSVGLFGLPGGDCDDLSGLEYLDCNDDSNNGTLSALRYVGLNPGEDYYIQVVGHDGDEGDFCLEIVETVGNDFFCDAALLTVGETCTEAVWENIGATNEENEPLPYCFKPVTPDEVYPRSVWFKFVGPPSGYVSINTAIDVPGANIADAAIALYAWEGNDCNDLTGLVNLDCADQSEIIDREFYPVIWRSATVPGDTFYVQVSGYHEYNEGNFCIEVQEIPPPQILYVDDDANGVADGSSWADAFNDLQEAIAIADSGTEIWVAEGTYHPTQVDDQGEFFEFPSDVRMLGGFEGIETDLWERPRHWWEYPTHLSGEINDPQDPVDNSFRVMAMFGVNINSLLDGFIIDHGHAQNPNEPLMAGAGLYIEFSDGPTIKNCQFYGNFAEGPGAGVYSIESDPNFVDVVFENNESDFDGSGVYIERGDNIGDESGRFWRCAFYGNHTPAGGAACYVEVSKPNFIDCTFAGNHSDVDAGAVRVWEESQVLFLRCDFIENSCGVDGGAVSISAGKETSFWNCFFHKNHAYGSGGAIWMRETFPRIHECSFDSNSAEWGGALYIRTGSLLMEDCNFTHNHASINGGGAVYFGTFATTNGNTFYRNRTDGKGGGVQYNSSNGIAEYDNYEENYAGGNGGGVSVDGGSEPLLTNCTFLLDSAWNGGGISSELLGLVTLNHCRISECVAYGFTLGDPGIDGGLGGGFFIAQNGPFAHYTEFLSNVAHVDGGGIYAGRAADPKFEDCLLVGNLAFENGGGLASKTARCNILRTTFIENEASNGGGLHSTVSGRMEVFNCTFLENTAFDRGGAIFRDVANDEGLLSHSTIYRNTAGFGAGLFLEGNFGFRGANLLISDNTDFNGDPSNMYSERPWSFRSGLIDPPMEAGNLISDTTGIFATLYPPDIFGNTADPVDPLLGDPDTTWHEGFPIITLPLLPGSPAIGAGQVFGDTDVDEDQRQYGRKLDERNSIDGDPRTDIGAFEVQTTFVEIPDDNEVCLNQESYVPMGTIRLVDPTGGGFEPTYDADGSEVNTLILSAPEGVEFLPGEGEVNWENFDWVDIEVVEDQIEIFFEKTYRPEPGHIDIEGIQIRVFEDTEPEPAHIYRTGGNAIVRDNATEDSVIHAIIVPFEMIRIADGTYFEDFETDPGNWIKFGENALWEWGTLNPDFNFAGLPDNKAWVTGLDSAYGVNEQTWLVSGCFDFREVSAPVLALDQRSDAQFGFDGAVLQYSLESGEGDSWITLGKEGSGRNWYQSSTMIANPGNQPPGPWVGWTGREMDWETAIHKLDELIDQPSVRFRFAFASSSEVDNSLSNNGFAFDNFFIGERERRILVEHFTEEGRQPQNLGIQELGIDNPGFVIPVQYHVTPGEEFYERNPAGPRARSLVYGISEPGIAAMNGSRFLGLASSLNQDTLDVELLNTPVFTVKIDTTASLPFHVQGFEDIQEEVLIHVAVTENTPDLRQVFRTFLPNPGGLSFNGWSSGAEENFSLTWSADNLPSPSIVDEYDSLHVVLFVQNAGTKEVYQVATSPIWSGLLDPSILREGIFPELHSQLALYPNPANGQLFLELASPVMVPPEITMTDMQGRSWPIIPIRVGSGLYAMNIQDLANGIYHVQARIDDNMIIREKITVLHP